MSVRLGEWRRGDGAGTGLRRRTITRVPDPRDDDGSILPLVAVFTALCLALVLVVLAAGSLYLERKRLLTLADGAALAGAESFPIDRAPAHPRELPTLEETEVRAAVDDYLVAAGPADNPVEVVRAGSPDGHTASVTLATAWRPPILSAFVPDGVRIEVSASARSVLG